MSTTTESNTPQPYANSQGGFSSPDVGAPTHGLVQPQSQSQTRPDPQSDGPVTRSKSNVQPNGGTSEKDLPPGPSTDGQADPKSTEPSSQNGSQMGREQPAEEEGGAAKGEGHGEGGAPPEPEGGYPEQLHAGRLEGVGPEYDSANRVKLSERIQGVKEQIKGTIKRDPELKKTGKERMTGELKRKQKEEAEGVDPFKTADDDKDKKVDDKADRGMPPRKRTQSSHDGDQRGDKPMDVDDKDPAKQNEQGLTDMPSAHPTDKGAQEQAASVKPEGSKLTQEEQSARSNAESAKATSS